MYSLHSVGGYATISENFQHFARLTRPAVEAAGIGRSDYCLNIPADFAVGIIASLNSDPS